MRREKQKARTRQQIKDAFIALLKVKSIEQITVTELAKKADVDRKTVYIYYPTVYDIIKEIEDSIIEGLNKILEQDNSTDWKKFLCGLNSLMEKDLEFYTIVANNNLSFIIDDCTNILIDILCKSIFYSKINTNDELLIVHYVAYGIVGLYKEWLKSKEKLPLECLINVMDKMLNTTLSQYNLL